MASKTDAFAGGRERATVELGTVREPSPTAGVPGTLYRDIPNAPLLLDRTGLTISPTPGHIAAQICSRIKSGKCAPH